MLTSDLEYDLPERLIATRPVEPRDSARLLVYHRDGDRVEHRTVRDLPEYTRPGDLMVFNESAVLPARVQGRRADSGGRIEGLFVALRPDGSWRMMLRSNGRLRPGVVVTLHDATDRPGAWALELVERAGDQWLARVSPADPPARVLESVGLTPLPPYIVRARGDAGDAADDAADRHWYQTVYADPAARRSVAAPTAGLHFTRELLGMLDRRGVRRAAVRLHVGPGTFKPISADEVAAHDLDAESYEVPAATLACLLDHERAGGGRLIAVGTTTVRTLESLPAPLPVPLPGIDEPLRGSTNLLICPPYELRRVDALMTNFHLPRSSLLALVAAFVGLDRLQAVYREAVGRAYRFYSYGDAMLIV